MSFYLKKYDTKVNFILIPVVEKILNIHSKSINQIIKCLVDNIVKIFILNLTNAHTKYFMSFIYGCDT